MTFQQIVGDRRKALALEVNTSLPGWRVTRVLDRPIAESGKPELIVVENGPEFAGRLLDQWAYFGKFPSEKVFTRVVEHGAVQKPLPNLQPIHIQP